MPRTLPAGPDMAGHRAWVQHLRELRDVAVGDAVMAMQVLSMHAERHSLTRGDLVPIAGAFGPGRWHRSAIDAAHRLLVDLGEDPAQPFRLAREIAEAAGDGDDHGLDHVLVMYAVDALIAFGARSGTTVAALLPMWLHYDEMSDEHVDWVLARFPGGPEHLAPVSPAP